MAKKKLEIGDIIKCRSQEDMEYTAKVLKNCGIITTRILKRNGRNGSWLKVRGFAGKRATFAEERE
jgi:ribosomal protein L16/L10AE